MGPLDLPRGKIDAGHFSVGQLCQEFAVAAADFEYAGLSGNHQAIIMREQVPIAARQITGRFGLIEVGAQLGPWIGGGVI